MSQANELLNGLSEDEIATYSTVSETMPHVVIAADRNLNVPEELKKIAVQYDKNIMTIPFDCLRFWNGRDLSEMTLYVNYMRPDGEPGSYLVEDVSVDEADDTILHFSWTIDSHATYAKGKLKVLVCAKKVDEETGIEERHWNSELNNDFYVSAGMECSESIIDANPDIITQLLMRIDTAEKAVFTAEVTNALRLYSEIEQTVEEAKAEHQELDARITELLNVNTNNGKITTYELKDNTGKIKGRIISSGAYAVLVVTYLDFSITTDDNWNSLHAIPMQYEPIDNVPAEYLFTGVSGGSEGAVMAIRKTDSGCQLSVRSGGSDGRADVGDLAEPIIIAYPLKSVAIDELKDLRVARSGKRYNSAGDMARTEFNWYTAECERNVAFDQKLYCILERDPFEESQTYGITEMIMSGYVTWTDTDGTAYSSYFNTDITRQCQGVNLNASQTLMINGVVCGKTTAGLPTTPKTFAIKAVIQRPHNYNGISGITHTDASNNYNNILAMALYNVWVYDPSAGWKEASLSGIKVRTILHHYLEQR